MIQSAVTVCLVSAARSGPFLFHEDIVKASATAHRLGFDAIEVFAPDPNAPELAALPDLLAEQQLALAAVGTGAGWLLHGLSLTHPEPEHRLQALRFVEGMIEWGARFQAPAIIGSMQGRWQEPTQRANVLNALADGLRHLGAYAADRGVPLLYEPLNRYESNLLNTITEAVAFLQSNHLTNIKLLADLFHMNIEEQDLAAALRVGGSHLGHIHFVDSNRRPAGNGHIDYAPIVQALKDIGYKGYASAEAFPYPEPEAAARQTIETFRRFFRSESAP